LHNTDPVPEDDTTGDREMLDQPVYHQQGVIVHVLTFWALWRD
jgi:hypothetical protein